MRIVLSSFIFCFLILTHLEAGNKNLLPLGEREALIANTSIALEDSSGAALYNPANLTELERPRLSATATSYVLSTNDLKDKEETDGTRFGFGVRTFIPIPQTTVQTFNFFGATQAISLSVPTLNRFSKRITVDTDNTHTVVLANIEAQEVRLGLSWAQKLNFISPDLSFGATLFATRIKQSSLTTASAVITTVSNSMSSAMNRTEFGLYGLGGIMGLRYRAAENLSLGLRLESSLLKLSSDGEDFSQTTLVNQGVLSVDESNDTRDPTFDQPWDLGVGINWTAVPKLHLLMDLSMQFPQSFTQVETVKVETKWTPRVNTGLIWNFYRTFEACAGFQWNPSNEVESAEDETDFFGGTMGVRYKSDNFHLGIGGFILASSGRTSALGDSTKSATLDTRVFGLTLVSGTSF